MYWSPYIRADVTVSSLPVTGKRLTREIFLSAYVSNYKSDLQETSKKDVFCRGDVVIAKCI